MNLVLSIVTALLVVAAYLIFRYMNALFRKLDEVILDVNSNNRHIRDRLRVLEHGFEKIGKQTERNQQIESVKTPQSRKSSKPSKSQTSSVKSSDSSRSSDHHTDPMIPVYKISTEDYPSPNCSSSRSSKSCSSPVESYSGGSSYSSSDSSSSSCDSGGSCGGGD